MVSGLRAYVRRSIDGASVYPNFYLCVLRHGNMILNVFVPKVAQSLTTSTPAPNIPVIHVGRSSSEK